MPEFTIKANLLQAIARVAIADVERSLLAKVLFRDGEIVACDGHRLVIVKHDTGGQTFAMTRVHALAAAALPDVMFPPSVREWQPWEDPEVSSNELRIRLEGDHVIVDVGHSITVRRLQANTDYPPVDTVIPTKAEGMPPDGVVFNPRYLAGADAILRAANAGGWGLRLEAWGGRLDPSLFTAGGVVRYVIMPMRQP